jgi:hypothetical protein
MTEPVPEVQTMEQTERQSLPELRHSIPDSKLPESIVGG